MKESAIAAVSHAPSSRRHFKRLRRLCESRLAALHLDADSHDILSLKDRLSELRERAIHLVPMAIPETSLNGMWVATARADFVIYSACATRSHQEHIIAHELGHIMCDHQATTDLDDGILRCLFPDIAPEIVRRALQRGEYSHWNEQEAEMIASVFRARMQNRDRGIPPVRADDEVVTRLRSAITSPYTSGAVQPVR